MDIVLHEVGPRDGLQAEKSVVPLERKLRWIEASVEAGVDVVQVGSFVHPEKVPQMAGTDALFARLAEADPPRRKSVLSALVLNEKGLERGLRCGVELFCMGVSASETHSLKNTGMGVAEATRRITGTALQAIAAGRPVQVSVQSAFGCGYEGPIREERVLDIVRAYLDAGLFQISLADTAGLGTPEQVERLYAQLFALSPQIEAACHFHDTYGLGMANLLAALRVGVTWFETSFAGLGGCPFTKVAAGNVPTEDVVQALQRLGHRADVDLGKLARLAWDVAGFFDREMPGRVYKTMKVPAPEPELVGAER